jgi:hypothetical protein
MFKFNFNDFAKILPSIIIILSFLSSIGYLIFSKPMNIKMMIYWLLAGALNASVTWLK